MNIFFSNSFFGSKKVMEAKTTTSKINLLKGYETPSCSLFPAVCYNLLQDCDSI